MTGIAKRSVWLYLQCVSVVVDIMVLFCVIEARLAQEHGRSQLFPVVECVHRSVTKWFVLFFILEFHDTKHALLIGRRCFKRKAD